MKRYNMRKLFIFIYCLSFSAPVFAVQDTLKMDFATAVNLALEANLDYQIQSNQQEVLKKEKQTALASHFPSVNVGTTFSRQSGQQFQQIEGEIVVTNVTNEIISGGLNLEMPLFNSGRRIFDTQSSKLAWEAGEMGLERAAQQVVFDVARRYLQVLLDKELLRIANENLENQKALLEQITGFTEAGLRTLADQYNQQSEVARVESTVVDAEIQYENDLWDLSEYLQLEPGVIPDIIEVDPAVNSMSYEGMSTVELYDIALGNRVDIKQQELLTNSAEKSLKANKAMYYPRLNAFYNYSTFFTSLDDRSIQEQLLTIYPQNNLGMRLSIPIFNNLNNRLNVTRSRVQLKNQELRKEALDRSIYQDVRLANQNYQAAIRKEKNTRVQVVAAEEAQTAVSERFRLGLSNFVDLSTANQQLVAAKGDAAQAIYTLFFQEVIMRHALGTLNPLGIE
ncbi:TolC family protein [Algoriphagus sp. C2-7]|uniref:TolC family protein n=2 Tax=Algoriphagus sediminis TaxID=3057113 RepID=A0ABT7YA00_9BACT|nr:TolC family protein [Algoriphagus sediminis]